MQNIKKIFYLSIIMFSLFNNNGNAKYDKIFYDFDIKGINEDFGFS